jgi:hypothetical protein
VDEYGILVREVRFDEGGNEIHSFVLEDENPLRELLVKCRNEYNWPL